MYIYIVPNQAIRVAKLCFYYFVSIKKHRTAVSRDLDFDLEL